MRFFFRLTLFLAAAIATLVPLPAAAAPAPTGLVFEQTTARLPAKWSDTRLDAAFKFKNAGPGKITITEIESSCGCTAPTLDKKDYAPGESGELSIAYTLGGQIGFQRKTITLKTDSKTQPLILLALETTIPAPLDLQPQLIYWRTGDEPKPKTIRITLPLDLADAKLTAIPKSDTFKAELKPISATHAITPGGSAVASSSIANTPAASASQPGIQASANPDPAPQTIRAAAQSTQLPPTDASTPATTPAQTTTYELTITPAATDKITRVEIPLTLELPSGQKITRTAYAMVR